MGFWEAVASVGPYDHMQTICTSLQANNHTNTSSLNFYRSDALPVAQPKVSKHWRHIVIVINITGNGIVYTHADRITV